MTRRASLRPDAPFSAAWRELFLLRRHARQVGVYRQPAPRGAPRPRLREHRLMLDLNLLYRARKLSGIRHIDTLIEHALLRIALPQEDVARIVAEARSLGAMRR